MLKWWLPWMVFQGRKWYLEIDSFWFNVSSMWNILGRSNHKPSGHLPTHSWMITREHHPSLVLPRNWASNPCNIGWCQSEHGWITNGEWVYQKADRRTKRMKSESPKTMMIGKRRRRWRRTIGCVHEEQTIYLSSDGFFFFHYCFVRLVYPSIHRRLLSCWLCEESLRQNTGMSQSGEQLPNLSTDKPFNDW